MRGLSLAGEAARLARHLSLPCPRRMVGAFGPSLETFHRTTHLSPGQLGTAVLANRLAKLFGTVLWAWYAERISASAARGALSAPLMLRPHAAMAVGAAYSPPQDAPPRSHAHASAGSGPSQHPAPARRGRGGGRRLGLTRVPSGAGLGFGFGLGSGSGLGLD